MRTRLAALAAFACLAAACSGGGGGKSCSGTTLAALGACAGKRVGSIAGPEPILAGNDPLYAPTLDREFDFVTVEDGLGWINVQPAPDVWDFRRGDAAVEFAEARGMRIRAPHLA